MHQSTKGYKELEYKVQTLICILIIVEIDQRSSTSTSEERASQLAGSFGVYRGVARKETEGDRRNDGKMT